jgi:hypothetical protein
MAQELNIGRIVTTPSLTAGVSPSLPFIQFIVLSLVAQIINRQIASCEMSFKSIKGEKQELTTFTAPFRCSRIIDLTVDDLCDEGEHASPP